tara:strand:- start:27253 stop:27858 length:606 start_codon:yes stop_codon:yes gene_type:complete
MISHKHKCIFIHIPRTAGSSIEVALQGKDQWRLEPGTKHLVASTAKKLHKDYWDEYFKFSFVRNPWDRMVSMSKFPSFYGCAIKNNLLCVKGYINKFSPVEIDPRSASEKDRSSIPVIQDAVYLNILNEELDFIGKFENLQQDFNTVCNEIGIAEQELPRLHKSSHKHHQHYTEYYDDETREIVAEKYRKDIEYFGYKFGE